MHIRNPRITVRENRSRAGVVADPPIDYMLLILQKTIARPSGINGNPRLPLRPSRVSRVTAHLMREAPGRIEIYCPASEIYCV